MNQRSPARTTILVVDDEAILRMDAVEQLEDAGFATVEADNAEDALGEVARHPEITVVFTDINMPGRFDGLELARRIHRTRPDIRLILTSGREQPRDLSSGDRFVPKPYDMSLVKRIVTGGRG